MNATEIDERVLIAYYNLLCAREAMTDQTNALRNIVESMDYARKIVSANASGYAVQLAKDIEGECQRLLLKEVPDQQQLNEQHAEIAS